MTPSVQTPSWMTEQMIAFPSLTGRWYSLRVFFFHLSVYFLLSGDVRAAVCSSPCRDCASVYRRPSKVGGEKNVLCIVLGRAACQASPMALTCFPQFLHHRGGL